MNHVLPPLDDPARLVIELRFVPALDRDDAVQEAWVAHLEGRPVRTAVNTYAQRQRRHRKRMAVLIDMYEDKGWLSPTSSSRSSRAPVIRSSLANTCGQSAKGRFVVTIRLVDSSPGNARVHCLALTPLRRSKSVFWR